MSDTRTCHFCCTIVGAKASCPTCMAAFPNRRDVATMTVEERAQEFEQWVGVLEIDFSLMHQRLEELAGRPVWTHELAHPEDIVAEIRAQEPADIGTVLDRFTEHFSDKPVIVVETPP